MFVPLPDRLSGLSWEIVSLNWMRDQSFDFDDTGLFNNQKMKLSTAPKWNLWNKIVNLGNEPKIMMRGREKQI